MKKLTILLLIMLPFVANAQDKANSRDTFIVVEQMPEYPGGKEAMDQYVYDNFTLPREAYESGVQTKIFMQFIVNVEGKMTDIEIRKCNDEYGLCEEAMRVLKLMAAAVNWSPGRQRGVRVPVKYIYPIDINYKKFDKTTFRHKKAQD